MEPVQGFQRNLPFEDEPPEAPTYPGTPGCCSSRAWHPCTGPSGQDSAAPTHPGWKARPHPWRSLIPVRANPPLLTGGFSLMWLSGKGFNQELAETCGTVSTEGAGFLWEGKHFLRVSKGRAFIRLCFPLWRKRPWGKDTLPQHWDFIVAVHFVQNILSHLHQTAAALQRHLQYPHPYDQSYPGLGFSITSSAPLLNCSRIICAGSFKHCLTLRSSGLLSISPTGLLTPRSYGPFLLLPCLAVMSSRTWPRYPAPTIHVLFSNSCFFSCSPAHPQHTHTIPIKQSFWTMWPYSHWSQLIPSVETLDNRPRELVCTEKEELRRGPEKKVKGPRETTFRLFQTFPA